MNIEIISGSPRKASVTNRLALYLKNVLSEKFQSHNINIIDVRDWNITMLDEGVYSAPEKAPESLRPLAQRMFAADAFILVTPEYNGSYTPYLKNLFDHFPKQHHKAFGIVTGTPGALGGIRAAMQLQLLVNALFGIASPFLLVTPQIDKKFSADGKLVDPAFENAVHTFIAEFFWLAERVKQE